MKLFTLEQIETGIAELEAAIRAGPGSEQAGVWRLALQALPRSEAAERLWCRLERLVPETDKWQRARAFVSVGAVGVGVVWAIISWIRGDEPNNGWKILEHCSTFGEWIDTFDFESVAASPARHAPEVVALAREFHLDLDAPADVIKKRLRELARKHHPDLGGDAEVMKKLNRLRELLSQGPRAQAA